MSRSDKVNKIFENFGNSFFWNVARPIYPDHRHWHDECHYWPIWNRGSKL